MISNEMIRHVLGGVDDPELKKPLTELDMIREIDVTPDGNVALTIALTVPGCPMKEKIQGDVIAAVSLIPGVQNVTVSFVVMSDIERATLLKKLGGRQSAASTPGGVQTPTGRPPARVIQAANRFIAVASGKGGVGKSTVTVNLACALARLGFRVGLLDADVYGFSIPRMIGVHGQPTVIDDQIVPLRKGENIQVVSMGFFVHEDDPVIWRGPMLHKAIGQFLNDVMWRELDYLLLDLPPGTGDITLTISQAIPMAELLVVTTPQATAFHVAGRVARLAEKTNLSVLGVIENMAYFESASGREYIFGRDGGKKLAEQLGVPLLGEIPLATSIREGADTGKPAALNGSEAQIALFEAIARGIDATAATPMTAAADTSTTS